MIHHLVNGHTGIRIRMSCLGVVFGVLLLIFTCLALWLTVPIIVAVFEHQRSRYSSFQLEFWSFARSVGAKCHMPIGRARTPMVVKRDQHGLIRLSSNQSVFNRSTIDARMYLDFDFGFAGRLCTPAAEPLKWRTPGMSSVHLFHDDDEYLPSFSIESSSESLVRWLLRHPQIRDELSGLLDATGADDLQIVLGNRLIYMKVFCPRGWSVGDSIEHTGIALFACLRSMSTQLKDLHQAIKADSDQFGLDCGVCTQALEIDPFQCKGCGVMIHRGCREMIGSCHRPECEECADFIPESAELGKAETLHEMV